MSHKEERRTTTKWLVAALGAVAALLACGLATGVVMGAFSSKATNAGNSFQAAATFGCAGTQTVVADADSWIDGSGTTGKASNYGTDVNIWARSGASPAPSRTLVSFPLPSLGTCTLTSATLKLYASVTSTDGSIRTLQAYQAAGSWGESTVTWNNQPLTTGTVATTASAGGWRSWTVTSLVQSMYTGSNFGFLVRDSSEVGGSQRWYSRFDSREGTTKPALDVTLADSGGGVALSPPNPPTGLTVTVNADGTRRLNWTAPTTGTAVDFYRIYRDGTATSARIDSQGAVASAVSWTDTATGGSAHTYRVTAVSASLAESSFLGPLTG